MGQFTVDDEAAEQQLPMGFEFVPAQIKCKLCLLRWRWPDSNELLEENREHLLEHSETHRRSRARRRPQSWINRPGS